MIKMRHKSSLPLLACSPQLTHGPYVEMLVPRRKGQLLKLLILVPLSLLLATSIYYQFYYYEQPSSSQRLPLPSASAANSMAAPLLGLSDDYLQPSNSNDDSGAQEAAANLNDSESEFLVGSHSQRQQNSAGSRGGAVRTNTDSYGSLGDEAASRSAEEAQLASQIGILRRMNENNINDKHYYKVLSDRLKALRGHKSQKDNIGRHQHNSNNNNENDINNPLNYQESSRAPSSSISSSSSSSDSRQLKHKQKLADRFFYDSRDNQQLALDSRRLKQTQPSAGLTESTIIQADNDDNNNLSSVAASSSSSGGSGDDDDNGDRLQNNEPSAEAAAADEAELLREEEADAQDAAVIPPPSDPSAPGELGRPVVLKNLTKDQQDLVKVGWDNNAFNQYISDIISVNRTLPDVRDPTCKGVKYPSVRQLPPTSVIICFHNEAWSVLLRTVHSILNRSPRRLVKEIILVDDFSNKPHLGQQLEDYVKPLRIVRVVRAEKREGLIRARLLGAKAATAPVLTFLDSHCECAEGWLEPLLTRIHQDPTAVVCPVIDVISDKTFEYHYKGDASAISVGGFDWNLQFNWHSVPDRERKRRKNPYDPLRSPTMAGGLFSIDKNFFERLGTYDSGFDIWGGENLELSFKTWMCGGTLEILPCSHVGHVFRSRSPYKWRTGVNVLRRNSVRLAEVWMDDYKKYYYDRIGHDLGDYGDISERLELRRQLKCKPFSYFVKEIYPELFIPGEALAYGEVRNEAKDRIKMCLDSSARKSDYHKPLGVYPCHGSGGNQYWLLSRDGEIRRDEACVDYAGHDVVLFPCHGSGGNQLWLYEKDTQLVRHSTSGRCMELARDRIKIQMSDCDQTNDAQRWTFQHYNATLAAIHS